MADVKIIGKINMTPHDYKEALRKYTLFVNKLTDHREYKSEDEWKWEGYDPSSGNFYRFNINGVPHASAISQSDREYLEELRAKIKHLRSLDDFYETPRPFPSNMLPTS